jgi:hypothetical protein
MVEAPHELNQMIALKLPKLRLISETQTIDSDVLFSQVASALGEDL